MVKSAIGIFRGRAGRIERRSFAIAERVNLDRYKGKHHGAIFRRRTP